MKAQFKILLILLLLGLTSCCQREVFLYCGTGLIEPGDIKVNVTEIFFNPVSDSILVKGEMLDSLTHEPLVGAVAEVNSKDLKAVTGMATYLDGKFKLSFKYSKGYFIKFSSVGYNQQTYHLKNFIQQYFEQQSNE